jgi:hypothetical protein
VPELPERGAEAHGFFSGRSGDLKEDLRADHLWARSGITLEGKPHMIEQERAFEAERTRYAS